MFTHRAFRNYKTLEFSNQDTSHKTARFNESITIELYFQISLFRTGIWSV
ncbi:hypothetical protein FG05_35383 [Fusarium graminearum]|nr:hypothetical protein FG05_35383 [Fusarium graminearum]